MATLASSALSALARARRLASRRGFALTCLLVLAWLFLLPPSTKRATSWRSLTGGVREESSIEAMLEDHADGTASLRSTLGEGARGHPIRLLMREAKEKWDAQLARQSQTLEQAVATYRVRYGRSPPRGFEAWWAFARANQVQIVDDYDRVHSSITPFLALDPETMSARLKFQLEKQPFAYVIESSRSQPIQTTGARGANPRAKLMQEFQEGFREWLPSDFGEGPGKLGETGGDEGLVRLAVSDHDLGSNVMGQDYRARMMDLASRGETVGKDELREMEDTHRKSAISKDLFNACSKNSPAGERVAAEQGLHSLGYKSSSAESEGTVSFLRHPLRNFDFCLNPSLTSLHGTYSAPHPRSPELIPQAVLSTTVQGTQILVPQAGHLDTGLTRIPWAEKMIEKIFWRGSSTGDHHSVRKHYDWHNSHRVRLHTTTNSRQGSKDVLVEHSDRALALETFDAGELNDHLMDVGLSTIWQCNDKDGTCDAMKKEIKIAPRVEPKDALRYKYAFDIDGNAWSSRFRRLLSPGYVIFKMTMFPDWNSEWITPWLHYIPVQPDLSDLYHSATFFLGTPDGSHPGEDELAREMSEAAMDYVDRFWREEDMQSYWFRLLLEYRRAMAWDRDAMSMGGKMML